MEYKKRHLRLSIFKNNASHFSASSTVFKLSVCLTRRSLICAQHLPTWRQFCFIIIFETTNIGIRRHVHIVVFTNKRSQAKVFTVYLSLAAGYSYLECNNYTLALYTLSAELNQYARYLYTLTLHWPVRN